MAALVDFLLELGRRMEDPQELEDEMRARLDPALVDRLSAFSAARSTCQWWVSDITIVPLVGDRDE